MRRSPLPSSLDNVPFSFNPSLNLQRRRFVTDFVEQNRIQSIADFGCNDGSLMKYLLTTTRREFSLRRVVCVDACTLALEEAAKMIPGPLDAMELLHSCSVVLVHGDLCRAQGVSTSKSLALVFDRIELLTAIEVIEHIPKVKVEAFSRGLFLDMAKTTGATRVILTTPNRDFNVNFGDSSTLRHEDHKFEFTERQFRRYCEYVLSEYLWNAVQISTLGGGATLCACFQRHGLPEIDAKEVSEKFPMEELFDDDDDLASDKIGSSVDTWRIVSSPDIVGLPWADIWCRVRSASMDGVLRIARILRSADVYQDFVRIPCQAPFPCEILRELNCTLCAVVSALRRLLRTIEYSEEEGASFEDVEMLPCSRDMAKSALRLCGYTWANNDFTVLLDVMKEDHQLIKYLVILANVYADDGNIEDIIVIRKVSDDCYEWVVGRETDRSVSSSPQY